MKHLLMALGIITLTGVAYVGGMILFGVLTKFRPEAVEEIPVTGTGDARKLTAQDSTLTFLTWNIGYAGLGAEADYFYDNGKMVTSPKEMVAKNLDGIKNYLSAHQQTDFILLQEVDRPGKRNWQTDQAAALQQIFPQHVSGFAVNFDVKFLPFPFTDPIGRVWSGVQSFSKYRPEVSQRISLPGITDFPRKYFYLDRCLLLQRFALPNGKQLVVVNAHFEAYDEGGVIKKQQRELTKKILEREYAQGNYVVVGADWNIAPPGFDVRTWEKETETEPLYLMNNDSVFIEGWQFVYDPSVPTNRKNNRPYHPQSSYTTIIDYYLVSPNIAVEEIKTDDLQFAFSDHQPVRMRVRLKQ